MTQVYYNTSRNEHQVTIDKKYERIHSEVTITSTYISHIAPEPHNTPIPHHLMDLMMNLIHVQALNNAHRHLIHLRDTPNQLTQLTYKNKQLIKLTDTHKTITHISTE